MNTLLRMGAASAFIAASMGIGSVAHAAANADATATVQVLRPLQIEKVSDLDFGAVAVNAAGTATLNIDNTMTCSGTLVCTGTTSVGEFHVFDGTPSKQVNVTLPADIDLVHTTPPVGATAAATTIELSNYKTDAVSSTDAFGVTTYSVVLSAADGDANFVIGGDLTFDGSEGAGTYEGTFSVTVEYS